MHVSISLVTVPLLWTSTMSFGPVQWLSDFDILCLVLLECAILLWHSCRILLILFLCQLFFLFIIYITFYVFTVISGSHVCAQSCHIWLVGNIPCRTLIELVEPPMTCGTYLGSRWLLHIELTLLWDLSQSSVLSFQFSSFFNAFISTWSTCSMIPLCGLYSVCRR